MVIVFRWWWYLPHVHQQCISVLLRQYVPSHLLILFSLFLSIVPRHYLPECSSACSPACSAACSPACSPACSAVCSQPCSAAFPLTLVLE
jgi:hypothetical protein